MQKRFNDLIHNKITVHWVVKALQNIGHLEDSLRLERKLPQTPRSTLSVLNAQVDEILTTEFDIAPVKYDTPCYFAMSIFDPLLSFDTTLDVLKKHFTKVNTVQLTYPFHQPPRPFTFDELNLGFYKTIDSFMRKVSPPTLSSQ